MKVARNEKRKKLCGFSYYKYIANFEAFFWNLNLSTNRLFWRCVLGMPRLEIFPTRIDFDFKNFKLNRFDLVLYFEIGFSNRIELILSRLDSIFELNYLVKKILFIYISIKWSIEKPRKSF